MFAELPSAQHPSWSCFAGGSAEIPANDRQRREIGVRPQRAQVRVLPGPAGVRSLRGLPLSAFGVWGARGPARVVRGRTPGLRDHGDAHDRANYDFMRNGHHPTVTIFSLEHA